ncbi:putative transmembrane domain protein [Burkholderia pseudomallei]|nr:putative transmembrane domain protein [Burkholderia pseudomallei]
MAPRRAPARRIPGPPVRDRRLARVPSVAAAARLSLGRHRWRLSARAHLDGRHSADRTVKPAAARRAVRRFPAKAGAASDAPAPRIPVSSHSCTPAPSFRPQREGDWRPPCRRASRPEHRAGQHGSASFRVARFLALAAVVFTPAVFARSPLLQRFANQRRSIRDIVQPTAIAHAVPSVTSPNRTSGMSHSGPSPGNSSTIVAVIAPSRAALPTFRHQQQMIAVTIVIAYATKWPAPVAAPAKPISPPTIAPMN